MFMWNLQAILTHEIRCLWYCNSLSLKVIGFHQRQEEVVTKLRKECVISGKTDDDASHESLACHADEMSLCHETLSWLTTCNSSSHSSPKFFASKGQITNFISRRQSDFLGNQSSVTNTLTEITCNIDSPLAIGDNMRRLTQTAPCPCPRIETLLGSPPNSWMFSLIQCKAATWSMMPKFPRELPSNAGKNPVEKNMSCNENNVSQRHG